MFVAGTGASDKHVDTQSSDSSAHVMQWKFFLGACLVTAALLLPHAAAGPVVAGMALAGVLQWGWSRIGGGRERRR
jgi:hypothetical protein